MTIIVDRHISLHVLDDDASSELMLSNLMNHDKSLFPDDWYYSTELILHNQIIWSFLFNFFEGWSNVRFLGTVIIQFFYLASFAYMLYESGLSRKAVLTGMILCMIPYCVSYGRSILYHCFYVPRFAPGFIIIGLLFSFLKKNTAGVFSKGIRLFLIIILAFINSMLYVRQVFITMLPVLGCLFFYLLFKYREGVTFYRKWMIVPLIMCVAGFAGLVCNSRILIPSLSLYKQTEQNLGILSPADWGPILGALLFQFGFRTDVNIFSLTGLLSLGGLFNAAVLSYLSIRNLVRRDISDFREYLLRTMLPVSLLLNLVIFVFGEIPFRLQSDYSRYLLAASVWIIPALCCEIDMKEKFPHIRKIIFSVCLLFFVLNSLFNINSFLHSDDFGQPYDGLSYDNPHLADDLRSAVEFIRTHDYRYGYAFAGEANVLVELMNGLPVVSLRRTPDGVLEYANWLSQKSFKTISADGAFFLMRASEEDHYQTALIQSSVERIYFDDFGYVLYDIPDISLFRELIREPVL